MERKEISQTRKSAVDFIATEIRTGGFYRFVCPEVQFSTCNTVIFLRKVTITLTSVIVELVLQMNK